MPEIVFASVKDAVRWSEEIATIPDLGSVLGDLIGKTSAGNLSRQEMIDIAQTVTLITASCNNCEIYHAVCICIYFSDFFSTKTCSTIAVSPFLHWSKHVPAIVFCYPDSCVVYFCACCVVFYS